MTSVVGDSCVGKVKAVEVGRSFESDEAHPAVRTCAQQSRQNLLVWAVWIRTMTSCSNVINAIKNWSMFSCQRLCVWLWLSIAVWPVCGVTLGQWEETVWGHMCLTAVVSTFLFVNEEQIVLFIRQTSLSLLCHCFSLVHCFFSVPASSAGQHISSKRTVVGFCFSCFLVEISLIAWRGQCVCRSGRGLWRSGQ